MMMDCGRHIVHHAIGANIASTEWTGPAAHVTPTNIPCGAPMSVHRTREMEGAPPIGTAHALTLSVTTPRGAERECARHATNAIPATTALTGRVARVIRMCTLSMNRVNVTVNLIAVRMERPCSWWAIWWESWWEQLSSPYCAVAVGGYFGNGTSRGTEQRQTGQCPKWRCLNLKDSTQWLQSRWCQ